MVSPMASPMASPIAGHAEPAPLGMLASLFTFVGAATDDHIAHALDIAGLGFDDVVTRIGPAVVDPAAALAVGDLNKLLNQIDAIDIFHFAQVLTIHFFSIAITDGQIGAFKVVSEDIQVAVDEGTFVVIKGGQCFLLAIGFDKSHRLLDHRDRFFRGAAIGSDGGAVDGEHQHEGAKPGEQFFHDVSSIKLRNVGRAVNHSLG